MWASLLENLKGCYYFDTMLRQAIRKFPGVPTLIKLNTDFEDWWFDLLHHSNTSPDMDEQVRRGWDIDPTNFKHIPVRPKIARRELNALPRFDFREYAFIDFGCGKGRMLLIAAALPFKKYVGIELRKEFYELALKNTRSDRRAASRNIECLNINAVDYEFPDEKLVVYFCNPFGEEVMRPVQDNLGRSLKRNFRDVVVVLHNPIYGYVLDNTPHLSLVKEGYGFRIYRSRKV